MSWSAAPESSDPGAVEAVPASAAGVFRERLGLAVRYADLLVGAGVTRGLVGPREGGRIWSRHVLACAVAAEAIPHGARVADLGSGAGLPGIPLALARPDLEIVLVEPMARRCAFLAEAVETLGLPSVSVVRSRAEELARAEPRAYDVVTARAVTELARLLEWSTPLLRPGGRLVALKGARAADEVDGARGVLRRTGAAASVTSAGVGVVEPAATLVVVATRSAR